MPLVLNGRFLTRPTTGVERYGRALLQVIAREWPDARVVVPRSAPNIDAQGLEVIRHGLGSGHWWEQSALPSALRPDDVLLSPANTGPLRLRRQVLVLHDLAFLHHPEWFDRRFAAWYGFLLPRLARRCAHLVTVSGTMQQEIANTFDLPQERVSVVPPFLPEGTFTTGKQPLGERPYLLMVGAQDPRKDAHHVLTWYRQLQAPSFDLILVGRQHRAMADIELRPVHGVHVQAEVNDAQLATLYANALALMHASPYEGFGLPVLEALTLGCPVIAHDLPVLREQFGDAPLYADVGDPTAMQAALDVLRTSLMRTERIACGRAAVEAFSAERTLNALRTVMDPLLAS